MDPDTFHSENRRIEETRQLREQVERLTAEMKEMKQKQQQQHAPRSCSRVSADGPVASRTDNQVPAPETMLDLGRATSSASSSESSDENEDDDDEDDTEDGDVDGSEDEVGGSDVAGTEAADTQSGSGSDSEGSDETSDQGLHEASTLPLSSRRQGLVRQPTPFKRPASFSISTTSSSTSDSSSKNQSNSTPSNHDTWDEGYDQPTPSIEDHAAIDAVAMPPPALPAKSSCRDASLPSDYVRQSATPGLFPGLISRAQSRETDPMSGLGSINWAQAGFPTFNGDNPGHDNDCAEQLFGDADNFDDFVQYDTVGGASQRSASIHSFSKTEQHHAQLGNAGRQIPIRSHGKAKARASTNKLVDDYARPAKRQRTRSPAHDPRPLATASSFRQPSVSAVQAFRHVLESRAMSEKPAVRSELANLPGNARFKKQQEPRDMFTDVLEGTWPDLRNSTEYQLAAFVSTVTVASCRDEIPQEKQSLCWQVVQAASACLAAKKSGYR